MSKIQYKASFKIKVIALGKKGEFRIRFLIDALNPYLVQPSEIYKENSQFVDYPDNYPAQLITREEDRDTFLDEAWMSFESHSRALKNAISYPGRAIIHNIYTPNQMLTSRWWMSSLDPMSSDFKRMSKEHKENRKNEVLKMYQSIDQLIGQVWADKGKETTIVLSSDHGISPLNYEVRLNNLFAKKG
ncbi:MAG: alkaline phosphatase family protein [Bdellovibrionales bacterium]|nr:alkaline phosphatase family protein [Bdellovibrionales bacterium]